MQNRFCCDLWLHAWCALAANQRHAQLELAGSQLWVDKWKPHSAADLVGNPQGLNLMRQWLTGWQDVHLHGKEPKAAPGAKGAKLDMTKKALLLAGPPGIGKTTAATIISKCALIILQ
jgi:replication factor C subunit 1